MDFILTTVFLICGLISYHFGDSGLAVELWKISAVYACAASVVDIGVKVAKSFKESSSQKNNN